MARTADSQPTTRTWVPTLVPHGRFKGKPAMPLGRPVTVVGARNRSHLHLVSPSVSKSHAMIVNTGAGFYIRDLASRTHVHVNSQRVREADLREGDIVGVGPFTFRFTDPADAARGPVTGAPPPAVLRVPGRNLPLPISGRSLLIGRRPTCDLVLEDLDVSTTHAVIFQMSGKWFVRDLGSRTGTHVGGAPVHQQPLEFGDPFKIGHTEMTLVAAAHAGAPALDELEDLAGTAPLAGDEPLDLIFEEPAPAPPARKAPALPPVQPSRPAARKVEQPAARITAPPAAPAATGNGRAMPPAVPLAPPAPATAADDDEFELELAPPRASDVPATPDGDSDLDFNDGTLARHAAATPPQSPIEEAVAPIEAGNLEPAELAEPLELEAADQDASSEVSEEAPAAAEPPAPLVGNLTEMPEAAAELPSHPVARDEIPELEALDLPESPGGATAEAPVAEPVDKSKKAPTWRRLFGRKKAGGAEPPRRIPPAALPSAAELPAELPAEAPPSVADELPLVDLDALEPEPAVPSLGAADAEAEPARGDSGVEGKADEPADALAELEPIDASADAAAEPEPEALDLAVNESDEGIAAPRVAQESEALELETPDLAAAELEAPRAAGEALELEPAALDLDAVEVLDKTEPTPESALDLEAVLAARESEGAGDLDTEDPGATAAAVAAEGPEALTDSVFGREVEAFEGAALGPIVEAGTAAAAEPELSSAAVEPEISEADEEFADDEPRSVHTDEAATMSAGEAPTMFAGEGPTVSAGEAPTGFVAEAPADDVPPEVSPLAEAPADFAAVEDVAPADLVGGVEDELLPVDAAVDAAAGAEPDYGLEFLDEPAGPAAAELSEPAAAEDDADAAAELDVEAAAEAEARVEQALTPAGIALDSDAAADDQLGAEPIPSDEIEADDGVEPEPVLSDQIEADDGLEPEPVPSDEMQLTKPVPFADDSLAVEAAPVIPIVEETAAELTIAAPDEAMAILGGEEQAGLVAAAGAAPFEAPTDVSGTPPLMEELASGSGVMDSAAAELLDEPLDLVPAGEEGAPPIAGEPRVITGEILDSESDVAPEDPLVFEAAGGSDPLQAPADSDVTQFEPAMATGGLSGGWSQPVGAASHDVGDGGVETRAEAASPGDLEDLAAAPPAVDMFFGLERDTASFIGGMPLRLPPLRGPFAEQARVDFRGTAAEAGGGPRGEPGRNDHPPEDDAADEPELLLDLAGAEPGADDGPDVDEASSASSPSGPVAAALAPAEPGQPGGPVPPSGAPAGQGRARAGGFGTATPADGGGIGGGMIAGPFDMTFEDAPTDEIEIPPFDAGRGPATPGRVTTGQVTTAFDGLAMPPVRQTDVFSQTPLSAISIPPFVAPGGAAGGAGPAPGQIPASQQGSQGGFGDDDEPLDFDFDDDDPPARRGLGEPIPAGEHGDDEDAEPLGWDEPSPMGPPPGADRGRSGAARRPPAYPAEPAGGRPAPAKKKRWRIGKWGLFGLMLLCMAGAAAAIALGVPRFFPNTARITASIKFDDRFASLPQSARMQVLEEQRRMLESPDVRASAREIAGKKYELAPGFLLDAGPDPRQVQAAARAYTQLIDSARLADKRPAIELEHPTFDPAGDERRVLALLEALYAANKPLLDKEGELEADLKKAQADVMQAVADRKALQPALSKAQKELGESDLLAARRADVEMLQARERELSAKWDQTTARVRALLADVRASETATAPPDPDADPEQLPPLPQEDEQVVEMARQVEELAATLAEKKQQRAARADEESKALQESLKKLEEDITAARGSIQPESELGKYLASAERVQSQLRQMSLDIQQQQQSDMQRLTALKRKLADKNEARIRQAFAGDDELRQLQEDLALAERQYSTALGSGLRDDAAEFKKEIEGLKQRIGQRQDLLTTADGISPEVTELPEIIDDMLARMEDDRARNDRRMAEMLKALAAEAPAAGSLPAEQKAFAEKLEARQAELNKARQRYAAAMEAAGAVADAEVRETEGQLAALQAKIDERKKQVAEATRATMSQEQQQARLAATESRRQELARAEEEDKEAEEAYNENRRRLADAQHALVLVQKDTVELDRLTAEAVEQDGRIKKLNDEVDQLRAQATSQSSVSPRPPQPDHVAVIGASRDRRLEYILYTCFALGAVFFGLVLLAPGERVPDTGGEGDGDRHDLPFAATAPGEPANRNPARSRDDEPLVV